MSLQSLLSENHQTPSLGRTEEWGNSRLCAATGEPWLPVPRRGAARVPPAPAHLVTLLAWGSSSPCSCNWVSFEVDLFLIREILPFVGLSPGCQALFTWTVCSLGSLGPPLLLRCGDVSRNLIRPQPQSAAFRLVFPHTLHHYRVRHADPRRVAMGFFRIWKEFLCFVNTLFHYWR